jgi:RNA polymerase sigma factor (sigma-70 family)
MTPETPEPAARGGLGTRCGDVFAAYQDGDHQRLGDLVDLLTPVLWHTARAQGATSATAEDAIQTAWLRLVDGAEKIADPYAVLAWMVITVKRETWRLVRGERREIDVEEVPEAPTMTLGPEQTSILGERQRTLWQHISSLSARCQELLRIIAFADRPDYAAIAQSLGMPVGSIGPTRGRCLQKLRLAIATDPSWEA